MANILTPPQHDPSPTCRVGVPILKDHPVIIHRFSIGADRELEPGVWEFSVMFAVFGEQQQLGSETHVEIYHVSGTFGRLVTTS
jgi:hypothetical protein